MTIFYVETAIGVTMSDNDNLGVCDIFQTWHHEEERDFNICYNYIYYSSAAAWLKRRDEEGTYGVANIQQCVMPAAVSNNRHVSVTAGKRIG
jgi:hypothetical protein